MRVVIDTNVVISAALKNRVPEAVILFVAKHPEFEWVASADIMEEYVAVLRRDKFRLSEVIIQRWVMIFGALITLIEISQTADFPRDRKDIKFIACALSARADYFITGDKDFDRVIRIGSTIVLSVSQFKKLVCDTW